MSVIGFDIGNESCVIAAAKRGGIDVLLNDEAKCETPSVVSFGDKQRFFGSAGAVFATSNPKSTIFQIKRLIGRLYNEPSVQEDLKLLPFVTGEGPRGGILVELEYLNKKWTFTPVEIMGMLFTHLKQIAEKKLESPVVDCVIGIPSYFTDFQRREYLDAAVIAGLKPLRLIHDGTAIALGYGMYKRDLCNSGPTIVVFVDIGHCDTQVTVAAFEQKGMEILSHSFDPNLGGRDFDDVLCKHFAAQFKEKYNIDVYSNARALIKLRSSCEKVKKVLSANAKAPISIECLIGDTNVRGLITREEFEELSLKLLERVTIPCFKAIEDSGISIDNVNTIELVGSGSRIPAISRMLTLVFNKEPIRTLNASECVARGCALRCAMLSPTLVVRNYKVKDIFPYSVALPLDELNVKSHQELVLFPKGSPIPSHRRVTHTGDNSVYIQVSYTNKMDFPAGISPKIGYFGICSTETSGAEKVKVEFEVKLNENGIIEIESASLLEDEHSQRKKVNNHKSNLAFSQNLIVVTTNEELLEAQQREHMLAEQDIKRKETKDKRNTLKSFVDNTHSKLLGTWQSFATDLEKEVIIKSLQETNDLLSEDSDDESEPEYTEILKDLEKLLDPIENRYKNEKARAEAIKPLLTCIEEYRLFANSLSTTQKREVNDECIKVMKWLDSHYSSQNIVYPVVRWPISTAMEIFERRCKCIIKSDKRDQSVDSDLRDRSVDSDQRGQSVDSDQRDQPAEYRSTTDSLPPSLKEELLDHNDDENQDEKAREQALKPLVNCLEEYRLIAGSLPSSQKEEIDNECVRVEQWLNDLSQQNSSNKNIDHIRLSRIIKDAMEYFERRCKRIMNS